MPIVHVLGFSIRKNLFSSSERELLNYFVSGNLRSMHILNDFHSSINPQTGSFLFQNAKCDNFFHWVFGFLFSQSHSISPLNNLNLVSDSSTSSSCLNLESDTSDSSNNLEYVNSILNSELLRSIFFKFVSSIFSFFPYISNAFNISIKSIPKLIPLPQNYVLLPSSMPFSFFNSIGFNQGTFILFIFSCI
jgi:hypothetical protein